MAGGNLKPAPSKGAKAKKLKKASRSNRKLSKSLLAMRAKADAMVATRLASKNYQIAQRPALASAVLQNSTEKCTCDITLEQINKACNKYMDEYVHVEVWGPMPAEGTMLDVDEDFFGLIIITNSGGVTLDKVVINIGVGNTDKASLRVGTEHITRSAWRLDSSRLQAGSMVGDMFVNIAGIGTTWPNNQSFIHYSGRIKRAGEFDIYAGVVCEYFRFHGITRESLGASSKPVTVEVID